MRKKVLALFAAAMIVVGGTMTAYAAPSPSTTTTQTADAGQVAKTTVASTSTAAEDAAETVATGYTVAAVSESTYSSVPTAVQNSVLNHLVAVGQNSGNNAIVNAAYDVNSTVTATVATVVDIKPDSAAKGADGMYSITITNPDIVAGATYVVMHWNGSSWDVLYPSAVSNGSLTVKSNGCSPFAVVKLEVASSGAAPKTGEGFPVFSVIAFAGLAGAVVCGKKYFA